MAKSAPNIRLAPLPGEGDGPPPAPPNPALEPDDLDAARELAAYHRRLAAELPPRSQLRGLILRCAGHWSRLGAIPRNGLAPVKPRD
jgi:hypothetical protein